MHGIRLKDLDQDNCLLVDKYNVTEIEQSCSEFVQLDDVLHILGNSNENC